MTTGNHNFSWENSLFQWPFSIAILTWPEGSGGFRGIRFSDTPCGWPGHLHFRSHFFPCLSLTTVRSFHVAVDNGPFLAFLDWDLPHYWNGIFVHGKHQHSVEFLVGTATVVEKTRMNHILGNGNHTIYKYADIGDGSWHCFAAIQHHWMLSFLFHIWNTIKSTKTSSLLFIKHH